MVKNINIDINSVESIINGAVSDMNCSPSSRQLKKYKFFLPVEIICWQFYAACK